MIHQHYGQGISGTYSIPSSTGDIVLTLQQNGTQVVGTLVSGHMQLAVQGQVDDGEVNGFLRSANGQMMFEALPNGQELYFTLIPLSADNQPDFSQSQEFILQRSSDGMAEYPNPGIQNQGTQPGMSPSTNSGMGMNPGQPMFGQTVPQSGNTLGHGGASFAGAYQGNIHGTPASMTLQQQGNQVSGVIDASGYRYNLQGKVNQSQSQGMLIDPQTQGQMQYQAALNGSMINMTISAQNQQTGQMQSFNIQFTKGAGGTGMGGTMGSQQGQGQQGYANQGTPNDGFERDQRLVGSWIQSDSYTSGDHSFATQNRLIVQPNGTFLFGDSKVAGGGPGMSGTTGGGGYEQGYWRTQNSLIYVKGQGNWTPFARYYIENGRMLLTFDDGSRQILYRQ